jgi:molybdopterin converting factor small subunit
MVRCVVEFYGVPRQLLGLSRKELELRDDADLGDLLADLAKTWPRLLGRVITPDGGQLLTPYLLNINGRAFVSDLSTRIDDGDHILLITASAGG